VKFVVEVENHGDKKVPVELDMVQDVLQFGLVEVLLSAHAQKRITQ
jgi:hypothetical protein